MMYDFVYYVGKQSIARASNLVKKLEKIDKCIAVLAQESQGT